MNFNVIRFNYLLSTKIASSSTILISSLVFYSVTIYYFLKNEWDIDDNIVLWGKILHRGFILFTISFISYYILSPLPFFNPNWDYAISFVMSIGIIVVTYMAFIKDRVFKSEPVEHLIPLAKYKSSSLSEQESERLSNRLKRLLIEEEIFRENELRLNDLADYLNTSRHNLSQVINETYGVSFFELLNKYRVEYVKNRLADPNFLNYTIIQLAYDSGFNNKASFNRYFKKETGLTPSEYRIKIKNFQKK